MVFSLRIAVKKINDVGFEISEVGDQDMGFAASESWA